ncbi:Transcriptional regulator [Salmonella enterica subsp. enterica serovar Baildon str. R6-199]|nr:Transcriptional regulator [Salmonella enterica subsp. enterica serovar Baildon str. R6-199]
MSDDVLETYIRRVIDDTPSSEVSFCWQGGEPTLCGLSFYQKVVRLQQRYANGKTIYNSLQTNGVLINEEWAAFFAQHQFLIGISIDGPQVVHDNYRKTPSGRASFSRVVNAIRLLQANDVEFNTLTVVNDASCCHGNAIYHFLTQELESKHLQFIPIVEPLAQKAQAFEKDRARRSNEERNKLVTRIQTAVKKVANDQSIDLVVDANTVAYNSSDVKDITADVLKQVK